jgi:hypothetical protein
MSTANLEFRWRRWREGLTAIRGSLICAVILVFLDVVVHGSYLYSAMVFPIWLLVALVRAAVCRPGIGVAFARLLMPVATMVLVVANNHLQGQIARGNATRLILACERYQAASGAYPERLADLVPRHLNRIPRAKYCLLWGNFEYFKGEHSPLLYWYAVPPFGRKIYNFDEGRWGYLD